jgi:hypothetical protein
LKLFVNFIFLSKASTDETINRSANQNAISTTTDKPCELPPQKKKSNEKSEEKPQESQKKETSSTTSTTKKPKSNRRRRSAQILSSTNNKRCIGRYFGESILGDPIVGASNPNAEDCDRYESENDFVSSSDNHAVESIMQATPSKRHLFTGKSLGENHRLNLFSNFVALPLKSDDLIHGKLQNSFESHELQKSLSDDSSQASATPHVTAVRPVTAPNLPQNVNLPQFNPNDFLPSYEYFPKASNNFQQSPSPPSRPQNSRPNIVVGPSPLKSTPFYEHTLRSEEPEQQVALSIQKPSSCRCDPEHFNELLRHMQSSYNQFHNGMMQLFDTFQSQSNCGSSRQIADSSSSPSQKNVDLNVLCRDKNAINSDPNLVASCQRAFAESQTDPSAGYYKPPGAAAVPTGGFKNQFLSYADYIKMMRNVNANSGTVLSSSFDPHDDDDDDQVASQHAIDSQEQTVSQLKQHIGQYQPEIVAAPAPELEEPQVEETSPKSPLKFEIKSLLDTWNSRRKN